MKCVCGYYHLEDYEIENEDVVFQDKLKENNGKEEFIRLEEKLHSYDTYSFDSKAYSIYACPKCGTLKISI